jgi:tetratricopeptide (TPR) repeat protein
MLDCQLFGLKPSGHHLTSVLLHTANSMLLFLLLRRLTASTWRSFAVSALFGLHPLRVESVAWVSERKDVLSTFFFLLTLLCYSEYARKRKAVESNTPTTATASSTNESATALAYYLSVAFFTLGLMSKPMLVTVPCVLFLLDFWPIQRIRFTPNPSASWFSIPKLDAGGSNVRRRLLFEKLPFVVLAAGSCLVTLIVQAAAMERTTTNAAILFRLQNALVSYSRYLEKLFYPDGLAVFYPQSASWPPDLVLGAMLLFLALTLCFLSLLRTRPYLAVGWGWFIVTLLPVIGLIQVGQQSMADRYSYIPSIGVLIAVVWACADISRAPGFRILQFSLPVALCACFALTRVQIGFWRNSEALFRHALEVTQQNHVAHTVLAEALDSQGQTVEAEQHLQEALRIKPSYTDAHINLAFLLSKQRRLPEAIHHCEIALKLRPNDPDALTNLGSALFKQGRLDEAIVNFQKAIQAKPDHIEALSNLGRALTRRGRLNEAFLACEQALALRPDFAMAHYNLASALGASGRMDDAILQLQQTLKLKPDLADAENDLGAAFLAKGNVNVAINEFTKAVNLRPDNPDFRDNLAAALERNGDLDGAISNFSEALKLRPSDPDAQTQLQVILAKKASSTQ